MRRENIRIVTLLPEQFVFLIKDKAFEHKLNRAQRKYKDMFVFGTSTAMRFSKLVQLQFKNIEFQNGQHYLVYTSKKTSTMIDLNLPSFAVDIYEKYSNRKQPSSRLFVNIALGNFNNRLRHIVRLAGWIEYIGKWRSKEGKQFEQLTTGKKLFRFVCDRRIR